MENKTREIYKDSFVEYLLCLALDVGEGMLKNGAEVARVEDTIERICRAYGAAHVEVFTIISMINAAIRMPDGSYSSQLRRVKQTSNNLNTLENLNALSRQICRDKPSLDEFDERLHKLKAQRPYPVWVQIAFAAIGASGFCLFFGGGFFDALVTLAIGVLISFVNNSSSKRFNAMAKTVTSAFISAGLAGLIYMAVPSLNVDAIIIGAIMLLVPGLLFGTAMRDLLCGDLIAGTLKILQAILQTLMIGFGYMLAYAVIGDYMIPKAPDASGDSFLIQLVTALVTSVAFAAVFKSNKRHLAMAGVCGILTYATYFAVYTLASSLFWAGFISSLVAALFSECNARVRKAPSLVMLMPGVIPIVPGGYLYRTVRDFVRGLPGDAFVHLSDAASVALGIAGGVVLISMVFGILSDISAKKRNKEA